MLFDVWVVVVIFGLMMLLLWVIMIVKGCYFGCISKVNVVFIESFGKLFGVLLCILFDMDCQGKVLVVMYDGLLWCIYQVVIDEMQQCYQCDGNSGYFSGVIIVVICVLMDVVMVCEQEVMVWCMNWLLIIIEGVLYVGLFGIVIGIMLVFVVVVMVGVVDINLVVFGMVVVLLCMVVGFGVVILVLFGYNYLGVCVEVIGVDMVVFIDEFVVCLVEEQDGCGLVVVQG